MSTPLRCKPHPTYWFDDGSIVVTISDNESQSGISFKLHSSLISRHSAYFRRVLLEHTSGCDGAPSPSSPAGSTTTTIVVRTIAIPAELGVQVEDFVALLGHLYHDTVLLGSTPDSVPFTHTASLLRISSLSQLDIPVVHRLARTHLEGMYPSGPEPFVHPGHLEEALALAVQYKITSIQKGLYYSLVTTTEFEPEIPTVLAVGSVEGNRTLPGSSTLEDQIWGNGDAGSESVGAAQIGSICPVSSTHSHINADSALLPPADVERCRNLMTGLVDHFTPILFTPPTTPHMQCTDVFADKWMPLVVQSAITNADDGGIYKPLETLERIKKIDWAKVGLCPACVCEKRGEWSREQEEVWGKVEGWLGLDTK